MRYRMLSTVVLAVVATIVTSASQAGEPARDAVRPASGETPVSYEAYADDDCEFCRHGHGGHHLHKYRRIEGRDPSYNCGCNGSYKYPVPPLSTYHWPGMYSHVRMTDYHSPWRFPPIRPYTDDPTDEAPKTSRTQPSRVRLVPVPR